MGLGQVGGMTDLRLLVPTRGRPENVERLVDAMALTCRADTWVSFGIDEDDDSFPVGTLPALFEWEASGGPRKQLVGWTNQLFEENPNEPAYGSIGDDHVPRTVGWDYQILEALQTNHVVYPDDGFAHEFLATAFFVRGSIPRALGYVVPPSIQHMYADHFVMELGRGLGSLQYLPDVLVEHMHYLAHKSPQDALYDESEALMDKDRVAYEAYCRDELAADIEKVRERDRKGFS